MIFMVCMEAGSSSVRHPKSTVPLLHPQECALSPRMGRRSSNLLGVLGAAAIPARYDRHDRSVARRPSATAGTIRQHLFQLPELAVGRVDGEGERMVAASSRDGSIRMQWAIVKTFHNSSVSRTLGRARREPLIMSATVSSIHGHGSRTRDATPRRCFGWKLG